MKSSIEISRVETYQQESTLDVWRLNNRVTKYLFENIPGKVWAKKIPGAPRRTIRMIGGHIHNCRCMWIKMIGEKRGLKIPKNVNRHKVTRSELIRALERSDRGIENLIKFGLENPTKFTGFPLDAWHFTAYLVAHEGHHRGQISLICRQMGHRLPAHVTAGLWQWSKRANEIRR